MSFIQKTFWAQENSTMPIQNKIRKFTPVALLNAVRTSMRTGTASKEHHSPECAQSQEPQGQSMPAWRCVHVPVLLCGSMGLGRQ